MSAAHVRRGGAGAGQGEEAVEGRGPEEDRQAAAGRPGARQQDRRRWCSAPSCSRSRLVVLVALDIPAKAERAAGTAVGEAGFTVSGYQIVGLNHMNRGLVDAVVTDELRRAAADAGPTRRRRRWSMWPRSATGCSRIGWVKDARVSRRLPDTLVIDIVERKPAALWQNQGQLALIDSEGVVLDRVPVDKMPDLPLLIGPGANAQAAAARAG